MGRKLNFFLDIDGTILPFGKGIPESARKAIEERSKEGHRFFLCTGRSIVEIDPRLETLPLSGGVYSAGAVVYIGNECIYRRVCTNEEKNRLLDYAESHNLEVLIQGTDGTYLTPQCAVYFVNTMMHYIGRTLDIPNLKIVDSFPEDLVIYKLLFFSKDFQAFKVKEDLKGTFTVVDNTVGVPPELMAEIVLSDITKATGIERAMEAMGAEYETIVAIGDGANDIEMIEFASLGIAMGNASEELKGVADYITDDVEMDGLKKAIDYAISKKS